MARWRAASSSTLRQLEAVKNIRAGISEPLAARPLPYKLGLRLEGRLTKLVPARIYDQNRGASRKS